MHAVKASFVVVSLKGFLISGAAILRQRCGMCRDVMIKHKHLHLFLSISPLTDVLGVSAAQTWASAAASSQLDFSPHGIRYTHNHMS